MKPLYFYPPFKRPALPQYFYAVAHHSYRFWGLIHHTTVTYHVSPWHCTSTYRQALFRQARDNILARNITFPDDEYLKVLLARTRNYNFHQEA